MIIPHFLRLRKKYVHIFFDLDRTLWDFERNMRDTLSAIYHRHQLYRYFPSCQQFLSSFSKHNDRLWEAYRRGDIRKDLLRTKRFDLTLTEHGCKSWELAQTIGNEYVAESPKRTALVPHTYEVLEYLSSKYHLHIITNGFNEVQFTKLKACGIDKFFDMVITSEMSGAHKPQEQAFSHSIASAKAKKYECLMVGDDLEVDIMGAKRFGIDQVYFNPSCKPHDEDVTFEIKSLKELKAIL